MIYTYEDSVKYLYSLPKVVPGYEICNREKWMEIIPYPSESRIIHIAGTNGKGSTASFMNSILLCAGYEVGLFTSPHLVSINERIILNNEYISDEEFLEAFSFIMDNVNEEEGLVAPSFFDFLFFMAIYYYAKTKPEYIVLETGLGGRIDTTNYVKTKDVSVITGIGFDHMEYLGDSLYLIANEKAGIIKKNVPVAFFDQKDIAAEVFRNKAKASEVLCESVSDNDIVVNSVTEEGIDFSVACSYYRYDRLKISMCAVYQTRNASLAVLGIKLLMDSNILDEHIYEGLKNAKWAGRMEKILPGVYLDGAHNPHGIDAFLDSVKRIPVKGKRFLVFSVLVDKQFEIMVKQICTSGLFDRIFVAHINSLRAASVDTLRQTFNVYKDIEVDFFEDVSDALKGAISNRGDSDVIYIAGSLYLAGQIKSELEGLGESHA